MADTLTFDPADPDAPEFSAEDQENIAVGEALQNEQNNLLAGKYRDAEALEKAYIELSRKLGEDGQPEAEGEAPEVTDEAPEEEITEEPEESTSISLINDASTEYADKGELSPETMEKFNQMSSKDLVDAYIEMQGNNTQAPVTDLTDGEVNAIKNSAGGEQAYSQLTQWAGENLDPTYVKGFDDLVAGGNAAAIQLAVAGLKAAYQEANGYEGRMLTGKAAQTNNDVYRSQAQVVEAMSDPRYDNDPAYRQDVMDKLERSDNVQF